MLPAVRAGLQLKGGEEEADLEYKRELDLFDQELERKGERVPRGGSRRVAQRKKSSGADRNGDGSDINDW